MDVGDASEEEDAQDHHEGERAYGDPIGERGPEIIEDRKQDGDERGFGDGEEPASYARESEEFVQFRL